MSTKEASAVSWIAAILVSFVIGVPLQAYVLMKMWEWFFVPLSMPPITFGQAVGLNVILGYVIARAVSSEEKQPDTTEMLARTIGKAIIFPALWLVFAYVLMLLGAGG